jgi:hypothetical protein
MPKVRMVDDEIPDLLTVDIMQWNTSVHHTHHGKRAYAERHINDQSDKRTFPLPRFQRPIGLWPLGLLIIIQAGWTPVLKLSCVWVNDSL